MWELSHENGRNCSRRKQQVDQRQSNMSGSTADQNSTSAVPYNISLRRPGLPIKHCQRHNGPEDSESRSRLNFITTTKHQQQNNDQTSASKSCLNINFKILTKLDFMTKLHLPNLHQTVVNTFLIINMSNSNNLNKFWVLIFACQDHINQVY